MSNFLKKHHSFVDQIVRVISILPIFSILLLFLFNSALFAEELKIEPPEFSHASGFHPKEFKLKISHPNPQAQIYYTVDGSTPDPSNLEGSTFRYKNHYEQPPNKPTDDFLELKYQTYHYQKPILIKDRRYEPDRISQISTTFDALPDYFPQSKLKGLKSKIYFLINKVINILNYVNRKINWFINGVKYWLWSFFVGDEYQHIFKEYISMIDHFELEREYLYKGTPIRAIAILENDQSSIAEGIYFIGKRDQFNLPIINITVPEKELFDYDDGIFVAGKDYDEWLESGKKISGADHQRPANWKRKGENISSYFQVILDNPLVTEEQRIDIRLHGGGSRAIRNKTLRIYPRNHYSDKGVKTDLFFDQKPIGYSRILLRNSGNGSSAQTYLSDAAIQNAFKDLNFGIQRYQPYITFINGEYNGILNARDRHDKYYLSENFDLPIKKVDLLNNNEEVKEGDALHWQETVTLIKETDATSDDFFEIVSERIDILSFIDYYSAEIFLVNEDWPGNNIRYWRYRGADKYPLTESGYTDGRWRWLLFDVDNVGGGWGGKYYSDRNMLEFATEVGNEGWPNPDWSTFLFRILLKNSEFKYHFITRFSDLLNSTFLPERMEAIIRDAEKGIEDEMPRHIERWNAPRSIKHWRKSVNKLITFFKERPKYQWQHLEEFFNLDGRYEVKVEISLDESQVKGSCKSDLGYIELNSLMLGRPKPLNPDATYTNLSLPWRGDYFKKLPLQIKVKPADGYKFSHWEVKGIVLTDEEKEAPELRLLPNEDITLKAIMSRENSY